MKKLLLIPFFFLLSATATFAHCPLCTAGILVAASGAAYMGVSKVVISLIVGALSVSIGWWIAKSIKKQYIPLQKPIIILASFLLTVIPIIPTLYQIYPLYISWYGGYGSLLNRTYIINISLITSIFGALIICITPWLSKKITELRKGKHIKYQTMLLTFLLLAIIGLIIQFLTVR